MSVPTRMYARRVMAYASLAPRARTVLLAFVGVVYAAALLLLVAPIIVHPIGADDTYWILVSGPAYNGSIVSGVLAELAATGDTSASQPRFAQASYALRRGLAIPILELSMRLGIAPAALWSLMRIILLVLSIAVAAWFLAKVRSYSRDGTERRLSRDSLVWIALGLPLVSALGSTAQSVSSINGWLEYPVLTYPAIAIVLGIAALVLVLHDAIERSRRGWQTLLAVLALAGLAVLLNNSYEIYWVAIPLAALVLFAGLRRRPRHARSLRALWLTLGAFFGVFAVNFGIYRAIISQWNCDVEDCYPGSQVSLSGSNAVAVVKNVVGSLPLVHRGLAASDAASIGQGSLPWVTATSVLAAVVAVSAYAVVAVMVSRSARPSLRPVEGTTDTEKPVLVLVALAGVGVAAGAALITGINQRAPELMAETLMPYRTGYMTWFAISIAILAITRLVVLSTRGRAGAAITTAALLIAALVLAIAYPQNEVSTRANRAEPANEVVNRLHWEVALGEASESGEARRCQILDDYVDARGDSSYASRTIIAADRAFRFYHGRPFCEAAGPLEGNALQDWTG